MTPRSRARRCSAFPLGHSSAYTLPTGNCWPDATIDQVFRYLRETPEPVDMVSLNTGNIVFNTPLVNGSRRSIATPNSYDDIRQILFVCRERGILPEPAVLDTGTGTGVQGQSFVPATTIKNPLLRIATQVLLGNHRFSVARTTFDHAHLLKKRRQLGVFLVRDG